MPIESYELEGLHILLKNLAEKYYLAMNRYSTPGLRSEPLWRSQSYFSNDMVAIDQNNAHACGRISIGLYKDPEKAGPLTEQQPSVIGKTPHLLTTQGIFGRTLPKRIFFRDVRYTLPKIINRKPVRRRGIKH